MAWVEACGVDDIDEEDVIRWDHEREQFRALSLAG